MNCRCGVSYNFFLVNIANIIIEPAPLSLTVINVKCYDINIPLGVLSLLLTYVTQCPSWISHVIAVVVLVHYIYFYKGRYVYKLAT